MKWLWLLVPALVAAQDKPDLKALAKKYIGGDASALAQLAENDSIADKEISAWTRFAWDEVNKRSKGPMKYELLGKPPGPVLIYLHGGGADKKGNDQQWQMCKGLAAGMGFPMTIVPRNLDDTKIVGWWEDSGIQGIDAMIRELRRTHNIDTNQVYLGGYSMGGWGTSIAGPALADRFAAIYSMAGGAGRQDIFENLKNTPFAVHIGDQDTTAGRLETTRKMRDAIKALGYEISYKEYPGVGHQLPGSAHTEIAAWLKTKKRNPLPKVVVWKRFKPYARMFYWLGDAREGSTVRAEIKGQKIELTGGSATIYLNSKMINLSKEITVTVDGTEQFKGVVSPSLCAIIQSISEKEDPNMVFTHRIVLK
jgi:predicted esterase